MGWYKQGSVNVTNGSQLVTAGAFVGDDTVGPLWVENVSPGEIFQGPDFSIYEIQSITSNSQFVLTVPYRGATAVDQLYSIAPTQSFARSLAEQVSLLISDFAALMPYLPDEPYPEGSVGDILQTLVSHDKEVVGIPNQIDIDDTTDPAQLIYKIPATFIAPGSIKATGQLSGKGTATNDNAAVGEIGEYFSNTVLTPVALTTTVLADISVAITLEPGDYDVGGSFVITGSATSIVYAASWVNATLAAVTSPNRTTWPGGSAGLATDVSFPVPTRRFTVATATTQVVHLCGQASFSGGTLSMSGSVWARRRR